MNVFRVACDPPLDAEFDQVEGNRLIEESEIIAEEVLKQIKANEPPFIPPTIKINKPLEEYTWVAVGKSILDMHQYINDNKLVIKQLQKSRSAFFLLL